MFGGWGANNTNNATNNQAQPAAGGFGATNAFGQPAQNTGGFGAFGQPQANAAQPSTGFGTTPANNAFGAFGGGSTAFGAKPAGTFGATGAFGAPAQPAAGTGGFGGGGFGAAAGSTGAFGQTTAATNTTGTTAFGGGAFGAAAPANNAWGNKPAGAFGAAPQAQAGSTPNGTANPPYSETTERDSSATNVMLHYHSISCMPAYINYSPEELRAQDYAVGRKNASSNVPAGPAATGFGATPTTGFSATPTTTGAFGQGAAPAVGGFGGFGATNTTTTGGGLFGANPATPGGFGSTTNTTNAFGQQAAAPANPFAANTNQAAGGFGTGFGANTNTTGAFGAANNNAPKPFGFASPATTTTTGFGAFGQPAAGAANNAPGATNAFGQPATNNAFGAFGQNNANKPAGFGATTGAFGTTPATNNAFGQPAATNNAFGQPNQQANNAFGANPANPGAGSAFGGFGQNAAPAANPFGQAPQPAQNPNPFGGFGQQNQQQPAAATGGFGGGLFGAKPATPTATTGGFGGFGQPAGQQQNNTLGNTLGGGIFGQNNNNNANAGGGLFGQPKPGGMLGNQNQTNPFGGGFGQSTTGGFGATITANPAAASTATNPFGAFSGFGQPAANNNNASTSTNLFASSALPQQQQQQQQQLTASVDQPFNSGVPVFELLPGAAAAAGFAASAFGKKKQSNFFMKRKPLPTSKSVASLNSSTINPLRGFATSTTTPFSGSVTSTRPGQSGISLMLKGGTTPSTASPSFGSSFMAGSLSEKKGLNSEVFSNTAGRTSVKKLVLDKEFSADDLSSALSRTNARKNTGNALELIRQSSASAPPPAGTTSRALVHKPADSAKSVDTDKLEKGDYWIAPTESVLGATPFKDLESVIGFKCGRVGFGQVEFLDPVNLTTVGAVKEIPGKFILFDERECTVYPDENEKPPVGQGLNVRARITLENCWATDRATREPIKTEDHPKHAAHVRKLKNMPNTIFDGFDIETGQWSFIVEHFSRYGLGAEDDEEEDEMVAEAEAEAAAAAPVLPSPMDRSMDKASSEDDDESMDDVNARRTSLRPRDVSMRPSKEPTPSHRRKGSVSRRRDDMVVDENDADNDEDDTAGEDLVDHTPTSWPAQLGMDPQRLGQMQQSLFGPTNASNALAVARGKSVGAGRNFIKPPVRSGTPSALGKHPREMALMDEDTEEADFKGRATSVERPSFAVSRAGSEVQDLQIVPARKFVKIAKDSIAQGKESIYRDAGLAFGRSFRVGWGPGGVLVHLGEICGPRDDVAPLDSFSVVNLTKISTTALDGGEDLEKSTELLRTYMIDTEINKDLSTGLRVPQITRKSTLSFQPFAALFPQDDTSFEASLWRLASSLFDEIPLDVSSEIDSTKADWLTTLRRKMKVGDWLQTAVAPAVEQTMLDSGATPISKVFSLLTGNQIERACQVAMDAGDFHLATLITQIGGDKKFRDTMWNQWEIWVKSGTDVFIDEDYRKVYSLLAGEATYGASSKSQDPFLQVDRVRLTEGLDWKQAFALHYWYACPMEDSVAAAIEMYDEVTSTEMGAKETGQEDGEVEIGAINPPPWYTLNASNADAIAWGNYGDPMLHLLRLFQDHGYSLADTLAPRCFSPHQLDYRLSWTLFWVLVHTLGLDESSEEIGRLGDLLTVGFAMQLESQSGTDAAMFVLLHLQDPICREEAIKSMLMRHPPDYETEYTFESFQIPERWIKAAQGAYKRYVGSSHEAYELYIRADEQKFACDIVIADLVPDAIFRSDNKSLRNLFRVFNPEKIDDWSIRGKLFLDYADVVDSVQPLATSIAHQEDLQPTPEQSAKVDRIFSTVSTLLRLLPGILCPPQETRYDTVVGTLPQDKRRKAALDEMKSTLVQLAESLQSILTRKQKLDLRGVEPGARLSAVRNAAYNQFYASIGD